MDPSYFFSLEELAYADLFEDCSYVWDVLKKLKSYLDQKNLGKIESPIPSGVHLENPSKISIGKGTIIEPGAYIKGPCLIGNDCTIRYGSYMRGYVLLGDRCVVGHDTEVKHSIFLNDAHAPHFNYVGDSILGNRTNLGAGMICANYRFDKGQISIQVEGKKKETGLKKMGLILGDDSQMGCNCVTSPGTLIGKNVYCSPCLNIAGMIASHSRVKPKQNYSIEVL